ncbi:N4-gp56 family major capsid protein [Anaeromassilibacillus senegalensis]|uniref:N4-gp56 family major capsid protein n=1 Tax=Anaeromassilibacillus senegalensis TaxID=1673717 RepID=UPI0009E35C36|nr:N4-gp56 family major capsid protein [Anaeromassilibacillus senegalensis]
MGDAEDVAEGVEVTPAKMSTTTKTATVKKAMKAVSLTDEAVLSGYGNPVGEANGQLAKAIASKVDNDCMDALQTATIVFDGSAKKIDYTGIVDAIDLLDEEVNTEKVLFVHPKQVTDLRKDANFLSADKYTAGVVMSGEIGKICNCRVVASKKVPAVKVGASGSQVDCYACPIVKLEQDAETEDEVPAITIYLKRDTNVETERHTLSRTTDVSADKHYVATLSNEAKVVLAKFKK